MSEDIGHGEIMERTDTTERVAHTAERFSYTILGRVSQSCSVDTSQREICEMLIERMQNGMDAAEAAREVEDSFRNTDS